MNFSKYLLASYVTIQLFGCAGSTTSTQNNPIFQPVDPVTIELFSPASIAGSDPTPTVLIDNVEGGATIRIYEGSSCSNLITTSTATGSQLKITLPTLTEGVHNFYVIAQTTLGFSDCVGPAIYTLDTGTPAAPAITSPTNGSIVGPNVTLRGTCETDATVHVTGDLTASKDVVCSGGLFNAAIIFSGANGAKNVSANQTDTAGNTSPSDAVTYTLNSTLITVTVNQAVGQADPTNNQVVNFTVVFSAAIDPTSFTLADITNSGTATGLVGATPTTSDNITWTISTSSIGGDGTVVPSIAGGRVFDLLGNTNAASSSSDNSVTYDTGAPTVTINQAGGQSDPTNDPNISFTIVFSEPIDPLTFDASDITNSGDAPGVTFNNPTTSDNVTWTLMTSAVGGVGTLIPSIAASSVTDSAGNGNAVSTSSDNSVLFNATGPTVTVNQSVSQVDPTNDSNISFTIVFNTAIDPLTFDASDITQSGTATSVVFNTPTTSDNITWTLTTSSVGGDGTIIPSLGAGVVTDPIGNGNVVSTSSDHTVTFDSTGPSVSVEQDILQSDPTNNSTIQFTITLDEAIDPLTFDATDISNSGTAMGVVFNNPTTSDNVTWTVTTSSVGSDGTIVPSLNASAVQDIVGNNSNASISMDNSVTYDASAPTVSIDTPMTTITNSNQTSYSFTGTCSEDGDTITVTAPVAISGQTTNCTSNTFTFSNQDVSSITDGTINFTVSIADPTGNFSTDTQSATKDSSVPLFSSVSLVSPSSSPSNDTTPTLQVDGVFDIGDEITLYSDMTCTTPISMSTAASSNNTITLDTNALFDGTYSIFAGGTDSVGNSSCDSTDFVSYTVDAIPPSIANGALAVINNANKASYSFSGTCSEDGQTVSLTSPITSDTTCSSGTFSFSSLDVSSVGDGLPTFTTSIMDNSGNSASDSDDATKDTIDPIVANGALVDITSANDSNYSFSGTCSEDGQAISLSSPVIAMSTCTSGIFTFSSLDLSGVAEGSVSFTTGISDVAGNTGSDTDSVTKDSIAPTVPSCNSVNGDATVSKSDTANWDASTDSGSGFAYYEMSVGISAAADTVGWTGMGGVSTSGQLTGISPKLAFKTSGVQQDYITYVRAVDFAGNASAESACPGWHLSKQYFIDAGNRVRGNSGPTSFKLNPSTEQFLWYFGASGNQNYITDNGGLTTTLEVKESGNYLLSLAMSLINNDANTLDAVASLKNTVYVNDVAVPSAIAANSFTRGNNGTNNPDRTSSNMTVLLEDLHEGDLIKIGTVNNDVDASQNLLNDTDAFTVSMEYIPDEDEYVSLHSDELVGSLTDLNQSLPTDYVWTESIANSAFTVTGNQITFNVPGDYFVALHVPYETVNATQAKISSSILIDGSNLNQNMEMISNGGFIEGSPHTLTSSTFSNVILSVSAGQIMNVTATGFSSGPGGITLPLGAHASLFIQKIDTSSGYYVVTPSTSFDWNTLQDIPTDSPQVIDPTLYVEGPTSITTVTTGSYMFYMSDSLISGAADYISPLGIAGHDEYGAAMPGGICASQTMMEFNATQASCSLSTVIPLSINGGLASWKTNTNTLSGAATQTSSPRLTIRRIDQ